MLTIDEYREASDRFSRHMALWGCGIIAAGFATGLGAVALGNIFRLKDRYAAWFDHDKAEILEALHPMVGIIAVLAGSVLMHRMTEEVRRDPRMFCPHCAKPLTRQFLVIATRNCPHCGRRVLVEPDQKPTSATDDLGDFSLT